jgi:hypothetical protein
VQTAVAVMPHNQRDLAFHERIQLGLVELVVVVKIVMLAVVLVTVPAPVFFFVCSCSLRLVSLTATTVVTVQRLHLGHYTFRQYLIWIVQI